MELGPNLKQTDAGLIPMDWIPERLGEVCKLINGRGFKPYEWRTNGLPIIRIQNLNGSDSYNYFDGLYAKKLEIDAGQLLYAWSGSRGTSFGPHVWNGPRGLLNYHTWKVKIDQGLVHDDFLLHALKQLTAFIEGRAHGASALVHVQKWQMEGFQIALPPTLKEQQAIAEALSDADALIESLEQLITKKRLVKQGAMQELLSAYKRLSGFQGEWLEVKFGQIVAIRNDKIQTRNNPVAKFCIELEQMVSASGEIEGNLDASDRTSIKYHFSTDDVLFGRLRPYLKKYWHATCAGVCSTEIWPLHSPAGTIVQGFLFHTIQTNRFIAEASAAYGTHMPRADWKTIAEYEMRLPPTIDEQHAIAKVLADLDSEITALNAKLEKVRNMKIGMMQELLTGRIRLI